MPCTSSCLNLATLPAIIDFQGKHRIDPCTSPAHHALHVQLPQPLPVDLPAGLHKGKWPAVVQALDICTARRDRTRQSVAVSHGCFVLLTLARQVRRRTAGCGPGASRLHSTWHLQQQIQNTAICCCWSRLLSVAAAVAAVAAVAAARALLQCRPYWYSGRLLT
jgi:hypothetical protein